MDPQLKCKLPVYREFQVEPRLSLQAVLPESHNHLMKHHMNFVNPKFYSKSSSNTFKKKTMSYVWNNHIIQSTTSSNVISAQYISGTSRCNIVNIWTTDPLRESERES